MSSTAATRQSTRPVLPQQGNQYDHRNKAISKADPHLQQRQQGRSPQQGNQQGRSQQGNQQGNQQNS
jgi:hypothetical protein